MDAYEKRLIDLRDNKNYRQFKSLEYIDSVSNKIDLTSNDYLGIVEKGAWVKEFFSTKKIEELKMSSVASRLLSLKQTYFYELEYNLASLYKKEILLFNSGYHANTGIFSSLSNE